MLLRPAGGGKGNLKMMTSCEVLTQKPKIPSLFLKTLGSIHRGKYNILYPVSNLTKVHIQMDMVLVTFGYSTHLA